MTGAGFHGVIGTEDARWLWPSSRLLGSAWSRGVPVDLELGDAGLTLSPRTRLLRGKRWADVTLAWDELGGASAMSRGHTGRTGGLTLHETFEVTLKIVGRRSAGFRTADASSFLANFPSDVDVVDAAGFAPLVVTMPRGDDFAAALNEKTDRGGGPPP